MRISIIDNRVGDFDPAARRREFDGVGKQIEDDLLHGAPVCRAHRVARFDLNCDPATFGAIGYDLYAFVQDLGKLHLLEHKLQFARFDLGHVENVADEIEEKLSRTVDERYVFGVTRIAEGTEHFIAHNVREAQNCVQRRAQLVAHIGEERRFGTIGGFGGLARGHHFEFLTLSLTDVARNGDHVTKLARLFVEHRSGRRLDPDITSIRMSRTIGGGVGFSPRWTLGDLFGFDAIFRMHDCEIPRRIEFPECAAEMRSSAADANSTRPPGPCSMTMSDASSIMMR